jgi:hypothetical protein
MTNELIISGCALALSMITFYLSHIYKLTRVSCSICEVSGGSDTNNIKFEIILSNSGNTTVHINSIYFGQGESEIPPEKSERERINITISPSHVISKTFEVRHSKLKQNERSRIYVYFLDTRNNQYSIILPIRIISINREEGSIVLEHLPRVELSLPIIKFSMLPYCPHKNK